MHYAQLLLKLCVDDLNVTSEGFSYCRAIAKIRFSENAYVVMLCVTLLHINMFHHLLVFISERPFSVQFTRRTKLQTR